MAAAAGPAKFLDHCPSVKGANSQADREEPYSLSPLTSLDSVGLCFSDFVLRFFSAGSARVGGGVPMASRAAAFTADAVRNGFGLRGFEGMNLTALRIPDFAPSGVTMETTGRTL